MLFLLAVSVISGIVLLWRDLQIYAPSNIMIRHVRSAPQRWRKVLSVFALAVASLGVTDVVSQVIGHGAPGWLNLSYWS